MNIELYTVCDICCVVLRCVAKMCVFSTQYIYKYCSKHLHMQSELCLWYVLRVCHHLRFIYVMCAQKFDSVVLPVAINQISNLTNIDECTSI